jgi:hypothetical protein
VEILLAFISGAVVGAVAHFALPHRATRGVAVGPIIGAVAGGGIWMLLTWLGLTPDNPLLWVAAIAVPAVITLPALAVLSRTRLAHDQRERERLRIA